MVGHLPQDIEGRHGAALSDALDKKSIAQGIHREYGSFVGGCPNINNLILTTEN